MSSAPLPTSSRATGSSVFAVRDFRIYLISTFVGNVAINAQSVAVGWQVYKITGSPLSLGYVGLMQFLPLMVMTLPAGTIADRFDRRLIMAISACARALIAVTFVALSIASPHVIWPYYVTLVVFGAVRAFAAPAGDALLPRLVAPERFSEAVAWSSSSGQLSFITGPAVGGALYLLGPVATYSVCAVLFLVSATGIALIRPLAAAAPARALGLAELTVGVTYVRAHAIILGSISLDLFAVLLGGAAALFPVYARDILHVGPAGLGVLRSSPALGATIMGLLLGRTPLRRNSGPIMFGCVAMFGLMVIVFGLSRN
ncbi:MAG TPA: MFS transporter, partial [Candidatus Binataceae bacterium]|nr:MFS transporter [Candidatus Binataceae bacterium]